MTTGSKPISPQGPLDVDAVIATRNRPEALRLSVPLLLAQPCSPKKLIVIDSSDDHELVAGAVAEATQSWSGETVIEHTSPGLPRQRNLGLAHVTAPIVFFPDDDSLLHPGALDAIRDVYARDCEGQIVGVAARETPEPPPGSLPDEAYGQSDEHLRLARLSSIRYRIDRRLAATNPFLALGSLLQKSAPEGLDTQEVIPIEYMTGFRMSFRTDAIRAVGFDEALTGHALGEDIDASFAVARHGALVGALKAGIYHHRFPGGRGDGFRQGAVSVLNRTYILCKHLAENNLPERQRARVLSLLTKYFRLRLLSYLPKAFWPEGRAQLQGMVCAFPVARRLRQLEQEDLASFYRVAMKDLGL